MKEGERGREGERERGRKRSKKKKNEMNGELLICHYQER